MYPHLLPIRRRLLPLSALARCAASGLIVGSIFYDFELDDANAKFGVSGRYPRHCNCVTYVFKCCVQCFLCAVGGRLALRDDSRGRRCFVCFVSPVLRLEPTCIVWRVVIFDLQAFGSRVFPTAAHMYALTMLSLCRPCNAFLYFRLIGSR